MTNRRLKRMGALRKAARRAKQARRGRTGIQYRDTRKHVRGSLRPTALDFYDRMFPKRGRSGV